jgi:hypothetical protein
MVCVCVCVCVCVFNAISVKSYCVGCENSKYTLSTFISTSFVLKRDLLEAMALSDHLTPTHCHVFLLLKTPLRAIQDSFLCPKVSMSNFMLLRNCFGSFLEFVSAMMWRSLFSFLPEMFDGTNTSMLINSIC